MWLLRYTSEWLGAGTPFVYAGLTYWIFYFLDKNASLTAKRAISKLIGRGDYKDHDLRAAVLNAFDHVYGYPLLRLNSLIRCAIYSVVSYFIFIIWFFWKDIERVTVATVSNRIMMMLLIW